MKMNECKQLWEEICDVYESQYPCASGDFDFFVTTIIPNIIFADDMVVDAVEVVRCKDCEDFDNVHCYCKYYERYKNREGFCDYGKKKVRQIK